MSAQISDLSEDDLKNLRRGGRAEKGAEKSRSGDDPRPSPAAVLRDYDKESKEVIPFDTSILLAATFDPAFRDGDHVPHPWQVEISEFLCKPSVKPTAQKPLRTAVRAANGSGKDAYVVAPFAIWFALTKIYARVIITTASAQQLRTQTEKYIKQLAERINNFFGEQVFHIRQHHIECVKSGSEIILFATDEPGRAEGYHPIVPDGEQLIIVNECKSVPDEIFEALSRCTGYNYWLEVSTPGDSVGHFYNINQRWENVFHITAYDCPHLGEDYIKEEIAEYGEHHPLFRSKVLAEFTAVGEDNIIQSDWVSRAWKRPPIFVDDGWPIRVGIDFAAGGDETCCYAFKGNKQLAELTLREVDTFVATKKINDFLEDLGLAKDHKHIFADGGGLGKPMLDWLRSDEGYGWTNIKAVYNQSPAWSKRPMFGNRGYELWFKVARMFEESLLILKPGDNRLFTQLATRRFERRSQDKFYLEPKQKARADSRPSPDRADALVLAFADVNLQDLKNAVREATRFAKKPIPREAALERFYNDYMSKTHDELAQEVRRAEKPTRVRGSLWRLEKLHQQNPVIDV